MRIGYSTGSYPRVTDTFIQHEIRHLRELGADILTFAVRRPPDADMVGEEQRRERDRTYYLLPTTVTTVARSHWRCLRRDPARYVESVRLALSIRPPGLRALQKQVSYLAEAAVLAEALRARHVRHLHNHLADSSCSVALLASMMGGFTFSFTIHGSYIFFEPQRWRIDAKVRRALFVVCISHFCRSQVMMFSDASDWEKLQVVHCGIDPALYRPRVHDGPGGRLLFVGRLAPGKGVSLLLESLRRLRGKGIDVALTVVGDGEARADLEEEASSKGITEFVRFVGFESHEAIRQRLQESDIVVLPSFAEGVPVSLMEALAAGLAVVATAVGGVPELVEHERTGLVVPPGDVQALTGALERLVIDAPLRTTLGWEGRAKVEREFHGRLEAAKLRDIFVAAGVDVE